MFTNEPWPDRPLTGINAYLGAAPIAAALARGASTPAANALGWDVSATLLFELDMPLRDARRQRQVELRQPALLTPFPQQARKPCVGLSP